MGSSQSKLNITHALVKSTNQYFYIEDWKDQLKKPKNEQNEFKQSLICDVCDENLIPKCGDIKRWHFSHLKSKIACPLKKINQHGKYVYVRNNFMKALIEYDLQQRDKNLPSLLKDFVFNYYKKDNVKSNSIENVTRRMTDLMNTKTQDCFNFLFKSKVPKEQCTLKEKIFGVNKINWIMSSFDYLNKNNQPFTPLYFLKDYNHPVLSVPQDYAALKSKKYLMIFTNHNLLFLKWEKIIESDHIHNSKSTSNLKIIVQFKVENTLNGLLNDEIRDHLKKKFLPLIHTYVSNKENESLVTFDDFFSKPSCFTIQNHISCESVTDYESITIKTNQYLSSSMIYNLKNSHEGLQSQEEDNKDVTNSVSDVVNIMMEIRRNMNHTGLFKLEKINAQKFYHFISNTAWFMCTNPIKLLCNELTIIGTYTTKEISNFYKFIEQKRNNDKDYQGLNHLDFVEKFNSLKKSSSKLFSIVKLDELPCWGKKMNFVKNKKRKYEHVNQDNNEPKNQIKRKKICIENLEMIEKKTCIDDANEISKKETKELIKIFETTNKNYYLKSVLQCFMMDLGMDDFYIVSIHNLAHCLNISQKMREKFEQLSFNQFLLFFERLNHLISFYREMTEEELIICLSIHDIYDVIENPSKNVKFYYLIKHKDLKIKELRNNQQKEQLIELIKIDPSIFQKIKIDDPEFLERVLQDNPSLFKYMEKQTARLCKIAIDLDVENFEHVKNKTKEMCDQVTSKSVHLFKFVPIEFIDQKKITETIEELKNKSNETVKRDLYILLNIAENVSDQTVIDIVIKHDLRLYNLNQKLVNNNIIKNVLMNNSYTDSYKDKEKYINELSEEDILSVLKVKGNGHVISFVKNPTSLQIEEAIKSSPMSLTHISAKDQTLELCKLAFSLDKNAIKCALKQDVQMCKEAFEYDPRFIVYLKHQTKKMCEKAIEIDHDFFDDLKYKTEKVHMTFLKHNPIYVQHIPNVSMEMKKMLFEMDQTLIKYFEEQPLEMINELLNKDPNQLKHINDQTKEMCDLCFSKDMGVFPHVIEKDDTMIMKALEYNPFFLKYVENQTQEHVDFALKKDSRCVVFLKKCE